MDGSPEAVRDRDALQAWSVCIISLASIVVLCVLFSYVFIWTMHAEFFDTRGCLACVFAACSAGACLSSLLLFKARLLDGAEASASLRDNWQILGAAYAFLVVMGVAGESLGAQSVTWMGLPHIALWRVPVCVVLLAAVLRMPLSRYRYPVQVACTVIATGVGVGYALAGDLGNIWLTAAMAALAWGCVILRRRVHDNKADPSVLGWFLSGSAIVVLLQIAFSALPMRWDMAVLLTILTSTTVVLRVALLRSACSGTVHRWGANPWELLPLGWVALVFVSVAWTEPALANPREPVIRVPPPRMPTPGLRANSGEDAAAWRRYELQQEVFDFLGNGEYQKEAEVAALWNAWIEREVWWRRAIKITSWIIIGFFTSMAYVISRVTGRNVMFPTGASQSVGEGQSANGPSMEQGDCAKSASTTSLQLGDMEESGDGRPSPVLETESQGKDESRPALA